MVSLARVTAPSIAAWTPSEDEPTNSITLYVFPVVITILSPTPFGRAIIEITISHYNTYYHSPVSIALPNDQQFRAIGQLVE
jgi:hypothetical protein